MRQRVEPVAANADVPVGSPARPRLAAGAWLAAIATAVVVLRLVEPDPSGLGTHRRLYLPPCGLYTITGVPCLLCGVTTSLAHVARLEPAAALRAQPMGVVISAIILLLAGRCTATIVSGRGPVLWPRRARAHRRALIAIFAGLTALSWAYKIIVVVWLDPPN